MLGPAANCRAVPRRAANSPDSPVPGPAPAPRHQRLDRRAGPGPRPGPGTPGRPGGRHPARPSHHGSPRAGRGEHDGQGVRYRGLGVRWERRWACAGRPAGANGRPRAAPRRSRGPARPGPGCAATRPTDRQQAASRPTGRQRAGSRPTGPQRAGSRGPAGLPSGCRACAGPAACLVAGRPGRRDTGRGPAAACHRGSQHPSRDKHATAAGSAARAGLRRSWSPILVLARSCQTGKSPHHGASARCPPPDLRCSSGHTGTGPPGRPTRSGQSRRTAAAQPRRTSRAAPTAHSAVRRAIHQPGTVKLSRFSQRSVLAQLLTAMRNGIASARCIVPHRRRHNAPH
jgi:hypothetical protein